MTKRTQCPAVRVVASPGYGGATRLSARDASGKELGFIAWVEHEDTRLASVDEIESFAPSRCGLGTKLYEAAAKRLCARGFRLASGEIRSHAADGFWQKQVRKKRATCVKPHAVGIYYEDFVKPFGWYSDRPDDPDEEEPLGPPCGQYALKKSVCKRKPLSLARLRRRKR